MSTITIYDLTRTLASGEGKIPSIQGEQQIAGLGWYRNIQTSWCSLLKEGRNCALTREDALRLADKLRQRKICNLRRQIERLQALEFTIVEEGQ